MASWLVFVQDAGNWAECFHIRVLLSFLDSQGIFFFLRKANCAASMTNNIEVED